MSEKEGLKEIITEKVKKFLNIKTIDKTIIDETAESVSDNIMQRFNNPFLGAFTTSLIIYNWKFIYSIYSLSSSTKPLKEQFNEIDSIFNSFTKDYENFLKPILFALAYIIGLYASRWINNLLETLTTDNILPKIFSFQSKTAISKETHFDLKRRYNELNTNYTKINTELTNSNNEKVQIKERMQSNIDSLNDKIDSNLRDYETRNRVFQQKIPRIKQNNKFPAGADYIDIDIKNTIFKRIKFKLQPTLGHYRIGVKFGKKDFNVFEEETAHTLDTYSVFLTSDFIKNEMDLYFNDIQNIEEVTSAIANNTWKDIIFELVINAGKKGQVKINDSMIYEFDLQSYEHLEKLILIAWGDDVEFELQIPFLEVELF